jgi:hypothetical protein
VLLALLAVGATARVAPQPTGVDVTVEVGPTEATVGDHVRVEIAVRVPAGTRLDPPRIGPQLGPFTVVDGSWRGPEAEPGGERWLWSGSVAAFRTGELELPSIRLSVVGQDGGTTTATSPARTVTIRSVLAPDQAPGAEAELADLKPPAEMPADHRPLVAAVAVLGSLFLAAGLLWWLHRRYAARLAAVAAPDDPFHRTPPHEWVYAELQKLLARRLAEQGQVPLFFAELSHIVKRYLGGRYRTELMERTTSEARADLERAGAPAAAIAAVAALLDRCDLVKFARVLPDAADCREATEQAYRVVDMTRPQPAEAAASAVSERGAA